MKARLFAFSFKNDIFFYLKEAISFQKPIQNSGHKVIQSPLSIDGDVRTCPPPAVGSFNAYWEANLTKPSEIQRIRIYNPKGTFYM